MTFRVGFLLYPDVTQLDMTGPAQVLSRMPGATVDYAWKRIEPVMSDCRLALMPSLTLDDAPQFDLLCVPDGIDFAFRVLAETHGQDVADTVRLGLAYDPDAARGGTPATARPEILSAYARAVGPRIAERAKAIDAVAARFDQASA